MGGSWVKGILHRTLLIFQFPESVIISKQSSLGNNEGEKIEV